jgi:hypothetical protein
MPSVSLTDVARMRIEVISFFLVMLLVSAGVVGALWNWLARDFTRLPRLSYGKALAVTVLWGLLFVVVLTMISGARELMTPGAWERDGATYKLRGDAAESPRDGDAAARGAVNARRQRLLELSAALAAYAAGHDGAYPSEAARASMPPALWELPGQGGLAYVYLPDRRTAGEPRLLAYEPSAYGDQAWALFTDGSVRLLEFDAVVALRDAEPAP